MTLGLTPTYFDGTAIQGATYHSSFLAEHDVLSAPDVEPIEVGIPGGYPESPGSQPQSRVIPLYVELSTQTQTALNNFKKLFDADKGDCILKAQDGDANDWRLTVRVMGTPNFNKVARAWVVRLYAPRPIWEQDSQQSDVQTITTSPATWQVTNAGTKKCYPVIQLKPTAAKAHTADYLRRWRYPVAWRSELEGLSGDGLPYPIDVANDALDTATEAGASRLQADGDDLRVLVNGVETRRDLDGVATATCKVWCSIPFKPMLRAAAAAAMTLISPANGESIAISNPDGLSRWPESGFLLVDSECLYYGARSDTAFLQVLRGSRGTTAATHNSAGAFLYRVQHDIQVISDYTAATEPNGSDVDRKPMIDLALSSNVKHAGWPDGFTAPGTLRSGQALRRYTNDNLLSPAISFLDGATPAFRDIAPSAAAPQFNGLEFVVPCGIKAAAAAIEHDVTVPNDMRLLVLARDFEGRESLLATYDPASDGINVTLTPSSVLSRLRYNAILPVLLGAPTRTPVYDYTVGVAAGAKKAQGFRLAADSWITGVILTFKKVTAPDGNIVVTLCEDVSGDPGVAIITFGTFAASTLGTSYAPLLLPFETAMPAGTYHLVIYRSVLTGGTVYLAGQDRNFAAGFIKSGDGAGGWNDVPYDCLNFAVLTKPASAVQTNTRQGEGNSCTLDNVELTLDDATPRTPLIVRGAQETIYAFTEDVLSNEDTGQSITFQRPILALNDVLKIDPYNKRIQLIPTNAADPTLDIPWACMFSDEIDWFTLLAGATNLRYVAGQGIGTIELTLTWRGVWA